MDKIYLYSVFWVAAIYVSLLGCMAFRYIKDEHVGLSELLKSSYCENCGEKISFLYIIPVLGYILSCGKCNYCNKKIPLNHFIVELSGGIIAAVLYWLMNEKSIIVSFLFFTLIAVSIVDLKTKTIPFFFTIPIFVCGFFFLPYELPFNERIYGAICCFLLTLLSMSLVSAIKRENVIAGGDIALMTCAGVWLGIYTVPFFIIVTAMLFIIHALPARFSGNIYTPMGPAICLGYSTCLIYHLIS